MFVAINYKKEMKKELFIACSLCGTMLVNAENIEVTTFKYAGPYALVQPYQVDSVDVNSKSWKAESLLDTPVSFSLLEGAPAPYGFCIGKYTLWRSVTEGGRG